MIRSSTDFTWRLLEGYLGGVLVPTDFEALSRIAVRFDLALVVLFGSRATDAARDTSDLDLGVLHREGRRLGHRDLCALHVELSTWSNAHADVVDLATPDAVFRYEVVSRGRALFQDDPGRWAQFVARTLIDHDDVAPFVTSCVAGVGRAARRRSS